MSTDLKPTVRPEDTLERLDIRLGRVLSAEPEPSAPKPSYRLRIDFGKYGVRTSVGRFTTHPQSELVGRQVMGVLNFEPRQIGDVSSEVLIIGIQARGQDSGEATFLTPALEGKLGSKLY
ncbi:tRNA-binding protein [Deinococcus sp. KNUC1210]|uniref:tRNA-binding protein n=1 Tax=Deinococcus sp. KNUC1210 TaxID=2917691 RepID=UPI001EF0DDAB|nr:tRNA-binding protein [Deinococcus sp. KNUC1210]ULH16447.1 tRNA-binding protein [Deinococcus sp. KNUC1210]